MKTFYKLTLVLVLLITVNSCTNQSANETMVKITTDYGNIKIKLYNETPQHRDNFIKLVNEGFYNDLLFHRVIEQFMIQGGDPDSKNAADDVQLGSGDVGYRIPAEFNPSLFHKKGALAAAREGSMSNPELESSGCQFYIVQGKVWTEQELLNQEMRINNMRKQDIFTKYYMAERDKDFESGEIRSQEDIQKKIMAKVEAELERIGAYKIPEDQKEVYMTIGGTPHLDGSYTVFGEVVEGLEVIDKIAAVETNEQDRPLENVKMKIKIIK